MDIIDNQPFMVLEWIAGEEGKGTDLRSWLRYGPLDLQLALEITIDICRGLIHAQDLRALFLIYLSENCDLSEYSLWVK